MESDRATSRRNLPLDPRVLRGAAVGLATGRAVLGVAAIAAPGLPARPWVGRHSTLPTAHVLARALGARDLVLGVGALRALATPGESMAPWLAAGGLADAVDAAATFRAWSSLPPCGRWVVAGAATTGAVGTAALCAGLRDYPVDAARS